jgi:hypothetical protein
MKRAFFTRRSGVACAAAWFAITAGCGGRSGGGTNTDVEQTCGSAFDTAISACLTPGLPQEALAHERARFVEACAVEIALPGSGITPASLQACANAIAAEGQAFCKGAVAGPTECRFTRGGLPTGAVCQTSTQCQSGECVFASDGGVTPTCGACAAPLALGANCESTPGACPVGAACASSQTCQPITMGGVGAMCDFEEAPCKSGLVCDTTKSQCVTPGTAGTPCTFATTCAVGLTCSSMTQTCQPPAPSGAACTTASDCEPQLGCGATTRTCAAVTWAQPGAACGDLVKCLYGSCNTQSNTCPTVIPDGQPCYNTTSNGTCDEQASCLGGVCTIPGAATCM